MLPASAEFRHLSGRKLPSLAGIAIRHMPYAGVESRRASIRFFATGSSPRSRPEESLSPAPEAAGKEASRTIGDRHSGSVADPPAHHESSDRTARSRLSRAEA